jgi:hypothetical protein
VEKMKRMLMRSRSKKLKKQKQFQGKKKSWNNKVNNMKK